MFLTTIIFVPVPTATNNVPFQAIPLHNVENGLVAGVILGQFKPSYEYANVFVPIPPAAHNVPFHAPQND